ncbi:MAG: response regulator [Magnetococcales bacterium]|nr:response regulator [Magnetococcales bacterium]NGZ26353.1 response regulator [Magnetococcales bacterium]
MEPEEKEKILIVDDVPGNISVLVDILGESYDIYAATNGVDALQAVMDTPPHLILLDVVMPGMDGFEVCRRLQASETTRSIAIIFITANNDNREEVYGLGLGALDFITRPLNPPVVLARVKTHLELRRARVQALDASRAKSAFLATMSHEIRTPLNGIIGFADLLCHAHLDDENNKYAHIILNSGNALLAIVNDILDFANLEAGKLVLESRLFNLQDLVDHINDFFSLSAREKRLNFSCQLLPNTPCLLLGDMQRLRQVLLALLGNALKFTDKGSISLIIHPHKLAGRQVQLGFTVKDTGVGIPPEARHSLFQAFYQVDASITRKYGGIGLGLVISSRLVSMMGGEIQVESQTGEGTTIGFTANFQQPLMEDVLNLPLPRQVVGAEGRTMPWKILLVDDDDNSQVLLATLLNNWGIEQVALAESGERAFALWQQGDFDLIFMDVQMKEMDGFEATSLIRREEYERQDGRHIPIVAVTADVNDETKRACLQAGMDEFLVKPLQPDQLLRIINYFFYGPVRLEQDGESVLAVSSQLFPAWDENLYSSSMTASLPSSHKDWLAKIIESINTINYGISHNQFHQISQAAKNLMDIAKLLDNNRLYDKALRVLMAVRSNDEGQIRQTGEELSFEYMTGTLFPDG